VTLRKDTGIRTLLYLVSSGKSVVHTLVQTEKGYRVFRERTAILDGMQLRFLHDVGKNLVPHLDMISHYFRSLDEFREIFLLGYVQIHPTREPDDGEQKLIQVEGYLYYGIQASVFKPELTETGKTLLDELRTSEIFPDCMSKMDEEIAHHILWREGMYEL